MQQVKAMPEKPSIRLGKPLSAEFEELLLRCLAKKPEDRPASARTLETALGHCPTQWSREQAEDWWRHQDTVHAAATMVVNQ